MYLDKTFTERLLEQLEDAQALLAQMLTSRYIGPLREEAAGWAEKLKEVSEVLEQWLEVQDLWHYLEAVFSNPDTAKVRRYKCLEQENLCLHKIKIELFNQSYCIINYGLSLYSAFKWNCTKCILSCYYY